MSARVLLVIGHGRSAPSLGHHLAERSCAMLEQAGAQVRVHDLLADGFDPVLRLAREEPHAHALDASVDPLCARYQRDVRWASAYVFVHPVWWFAPRAMIGSRAKSSNSCVVPPGCACSLSNSSVSARILPEAAIPST